uniref:Transmembrane protein 144 n=1 Tax=Globodera pallida TaxID=36090 RepID=A0A183BW89_GLOPA
MPPFQPLAMLGGLIWAIGNLTALPIIKMIGMGLGTLIWGTVNCIVGWATGRFGLFGVKALAPASPSLNYVGLFFVIIGGVLFALVPPKTQQQNESTEERVEDRETEESRHGDGQSVEIRQGQTTLNQRIIAIVLSVFAGICYGSIFTPVVYMQDNPEKFHPPPPKGGIYYVFPHFSGVYLTSTAVLVIYIAYKNNRPYIDNRLIFPSFLAGVLWAFGTLAWFWANDILSQAITFPITVSGASAVCSLWSVLYLKEVANEHLKLYIVAMFLSIIGVTMVGLSKSV